MYNFPCLYPLVEDLFFPEDTTVVRLRDWQWGKDKIIWSPKVHYRVHMSPPLACTLSQMTQVHNNPSYLSKIYFNIILPSNSMSSGWYLSLWGFHQWPVHIHNLYYMPCKSHLPWLDHSITCREQVMKILIMQFSPASQYFIPVGMPWLYVRPLLSETKFHIRTDI